MRASRKPARGKPVRRGATRRPPFDALFLDRDGTLVVERGFLGDLKDIRLAAGAAERLRVFARAGTALFIVTNQSGLARGFLTWSQVDAVNAEIVRRYAARARSYTTSLSVTRAIRSIASTTVCGVGT